MRTLTLSLVVLASLAHESARADVVLGAPGVPVHTQVVAAVPFRNEVSLPGTYKFVFAGIEAKGNNTGGSGSGTTKNGGGPVLVKATVSDNKPGTPTTHIVQISFNSVQEFNTSQLKTIMNSPAIVFRADTDPIQMKVVWQGTGNANKPDGIFNIIGEYQKNPPIPTGSLSFDTGAYQLRTPENPSPQINGNAKIVRE
jgi:hypothetical protein